MHYCFRLICYTVPIGSVLSVGVLNHGLCSVCMCEC